MSTVKGVERFVRKDAKLLTIDGDADLVTATQKMSENRIGSLVVVDGEQKVVGIVTERDIVSKIVAKSANPAATTVKSIMTESVVFCRMDTSIGRARRIMAQHQIRHLPIVDDDGVAVGMLSSRDVLAHELSETRAIARQQSKILQELETEFPGITQIRRDQAGRIVI